MELLVIGGLSPIPRSRWLLAHAVVVFAFLYLPVVVLILYSFNGEGVGGFPPRHLTLDWYRVLFQDAPIWDSVFNSLQVAFAAMVTGPRDLCRRCRSLIRTGLDRVVRTHPATS